MLEKFRSWLYWVIFLVVLVIITIIFYIVTKRPSSEILSPVLEMPPLP